jgi:hydrogenase maturation protease
LGPVTASKISRRTSSFELEDPTDQIRECVNIPCIWSVVLTESLEKRIDLKKVSIIGYGNPDREDDGVAWHILRALTIKLGLPSPDSYEDELPESALIDFAFTLQLTPEMAEEIGQYEYVCFVDAHTGNIPQAVRLIQVESEFQRSPFTHHLTPQSLLSMCESIYEKKPEAVLLSVLGHRFLFTRELSEETAALVPQAVDLIWEWMNARRILG